MGDRSCMKENYDNLNGLRVFAAVGIILGHVRVLGGFVAPGFFFNGIIASTSHLPLFFMMLSAFSMCCGYYERVKSGKIDLNTFYKRRYQKTWPVFALLCTLELIADRSLPALYEWFADLTLAFGLLPNHRINVLAGGWFVGLVFVFYMLFPFFVFLMENKKRAWLVMGTSVVLNLLCLHYFFDSDHMISTFEARSSFIYSFVFFAAGGMLYLYRNELKAVVKEKKLVVILLTLIALAVFYLFSCIDLMDVLVFGLLTALGTFSDGPIARALFQNRFVRIMSPVCLEVYLCHVFVFRAIEKLGFVHLTGNDAVNYIVVVTATLIGTAITAIVLKKALELLEKKIRQA